MSDQHSAGSTQATATEPPDIETSTSPLTHLFAEERHGDRQAREALFCTFNADLGFFERTVLGVTQSTGARVTVVGDARMSDPDPRAARNAGTRYVHGVAATPHGSAFHPKVAVVVGPQRALVAVGSGNLSVGGWHLNAETWTVATANQDRCPALVPELATWLRTLDQVCAISPTAVDGLHRTAAALDALATGSTIIDTGHHLVHSSTQPIIDNLPTGPIAHLLLYAPFHDENASAVQTLLQRFRPGRVTLAVQSRGRTVIQPASIERVVAELNVPLSVIEDDAKAYRHGKLIEAVDTNGRRWTLTGSPNLSASALLLPATGRGNIELGIVANPSISLFPSGSPISLTDVPAVSITSSAAIRQTSRVLLIAATRTAGGVHITFARPFDGPVEIHASLEAEYDVWSRIGTAPAGAQHHLLAGVDLPGGSRVRGAWHDGPDLQHGTLIFVTDPDQVMTRIGQEATRSAATHDPYTLLADPRLVDMWLTGIGQLAAARRTVALLGAGGTTGPAGKSERHGGGIRIDTDAEDWLRYSDDAKARMGEHMFHFALGGLPALAAFAARSHAGLLTPTDRLVDERTAGLDGDDANSVNDDSDPSTSTNEEPDDRSRLSDQHKRRIRRRLTSVVMEEMPNYSAVDRLAISTLVLVAVELGVWASALGEDGWIDVLATAIESVDLGDLPLPLEASAASFAAVAIYLIRDHLPTTGRIREALRYETATSRTAHLYPAAELNLVAGHAGPLHNSRGFPVDPDDVMRTIAMIVQNDPLTDATEVVEARHPTWRIHQHSASVLHIHGNFRTPFAAAGEALDSIGGVAVAAIWATSSHGGWALVARDGSDLIHVEQQHGPVLWRHYRLTQLTTATRVAQDKELANRLRVPHGPLVQPFETATTVLTSAGVNITIGAPTCF
ncbi:hypothetical protein [Dactylosporangium sp. NPDC005555]|uniref:hypothetical protein n=1 Tax=Dactylosporangium sp. NPDC005555 TaxID=3154889 RepID=UPI0033A7F0D7